MEDQSHPYTEVVRNGLNFWYLKPKPGYGIVFGVRGKADTTAGLAWFCSAILEDAPLNLAASSNTPTERLGR